MCGNGNCFGYRVSCTDSRTVRRLSLCCKLELWLYSIVIWLFNIEFYWLRAQTNSRPTELIIISISLDLACVPSARCTHWLLKHIHNIICHVIQFHFHIMISYAYVTQFQCVTPKGGPGSVSVGSNANIARLGLLATFHPRNHVRLIILLRHQFYGPPPFVRS